jgi:hypothetical protein
LWRKFQRVAAYISKFPTGQLSPGPPSVVLTAGAAKIYNDARASGKDHSHAVRILARAWIRVIYRCRLDGVPYDPARHGAAVALAQQTAEQIAA